MEFLRNICREAGTGFKKVADETWDSLGDTAKFPKEFKDSGKSSGKYALAAQLLMTLNFPHEAAHFRDTFNHVHDGSPMGAQGFSGTPIGDVLDYTAFAADKMRTQALGVLGYDGDISATSTFDDLRMILDELRGIAESESNRTGVRSKKRGK